MVLKLAAASMEGEAVDSSLPVLPAEPVCERNIL